MHEPNKYFRGDEIPNKYFIPIDFFRASWYNVRDKLGEDPENEKGTSNHEDYCLQGLR